MAPSAAGRKSKNIKKVNNDARTLKRKRDVEDLEKLQKAIDELDAKAEIKNFSELPLSEPTSSGLEASHFKTLTDIQSKAVPLALKGKDILGAAKTGSGKTLAFLVPVLENLYRQKWTELDGLGALIISPTRELAIQIFEVLRKIGRYHTFSAGLIIGGRSLQEERERLGRMNILVCTPGRMLQHMDQTAAFDVDNLQMLVLDEADRIMDMGFQKSVDAILEHLPKQRQTMLFSATQTKKVSDLGRLSLKEPEYVAVHEAASSATPTTLQQHYCYSCLQESKCALFTREFKTPATWYSIASSTRVGRTARYGKVGRAVLFLDPSEEEGMLKRLEHKKVPIQKINIRPNKTQDIKNQLQNMCFQDPELKYLGQKAFVSYAKSIFLQKDKEIFDINQIDLEGFSSSMGLPGAPKIKFQKGNDAKNVKNAPRGAIESSDEDSETEKKPKKKDEVRTKYDRMFERRNQDVLSGHYSKMIADDNPAKVGDGTADADEDNDFLSVKRVLPVDNDDSSDDSDGGVATGPLVKVIDGISKDPIVIDSKRKEKLLKSKKKLLKLKDRGTKMVFDEEGNPHQVYELEDEEDFRARGTAEEQRAKFLEEEAERVREADLLDKQTAKDKKREKREKRKAREAALDDDDDDDEAPELADVGDEDPMALLRSLPLPEDEEDNDDDTTRPAKRPKKWFEDDSDDERKVAKRKSRVIEAADEPETLEDLEALAAGLLN
ncbi:hypothetical protein EYC80_001554 [Monilinia laxa]|uniref:ATP-dependent RNA helicase n=2 Tax=Monilinia laxa TaxID=61186 RepID=A0A5N6K5A9_MONLA|nr:hypothetical protein EYC80_001554 [Monilinia laxa]